MPRSAALLIALTAAAQGQVFQALDGPPGYPLMGIPAAGISADGSVIACGSARWTAAAGWQGVGLSNSQIGAVSADGSILIGTQWFTLGGIPESSRAFVWRPPAGPLLLPLSTFDTLAVDASADGSVVVGIARGDRGWTSCFRWTASGGYMDLGHLLPYRPPVAGAVGISADGSTITGSEWYDGLPSTGFIWTTAHGMRALPTPAGAPTTNMWPAAISANGRVVVGYASTAPERVQAFVWSEGHGTRFLPLASGFLGGHADAVSADGSIIVGSLSNSINYWSDAGFVWDPSAGTRDLKQLLLDLGATGIPSYSQLFPLAISANGRVIVGWATTMGAFIARIPAFCYANCDGSSAGPALSASDFACFLNRFTAGDSYANCDGSTTSPALNIVDLLCFVSKFAAGCS